MRLQTSGFVVGTGIVLGLIAFVYVQPVESQSRIIEMRLPPSWVPFTARVTRMDLQGERLGAFYRSGDGSTRTDVETPIGTLITIHNVRTRQTYLRMGDARGWMVAELWRGALDPPPASFRFVAEEVRVLADRIGGVQLWEHTATGPGGTAVSVIAPFLNGLPVRWSTSTGLFEEYTGIKLGEPDGSVFSPPPGVELGEVDGALPEPPIRR